MAFRHQTDAQTLAPVNSGFTGSLKRSCGIIRRVTCPSGVTIVVLLSCRHTELRTFPTGFDNPVGVKRSAAGVMLLINATLHMRTRWGFKTFYTMPSKVHNL